MTTTLDNIKNRLSALKWGPGKENTVGVARDGFADPTGEFPKRDYTYGSSISKKARGSESTRVERNGGDVDVSVDTPKKNRSQFSFDRHPASSCYHALIGNT